MDEATLREKARATIREGRLPARPPDRTWGGPGGGAPCAVCELPVQRTIMALEIQFVREGGSPGLDKHQVHVGCFTAWERVRRSG